MFQMFAFHSLKRPPPLDQWSESVSRVGGNSLNPCGGRKQGKLSRLTVVFHLRTIGPRQSDVQYYAFHTRYSGTTGEAHGVGGSEADAIVRPAC